MNKEDIHLDDIKRILFGNAPAEFMLEVFFRTLIVYTLLLFAVRWLGKRMAGQLTINEMSVMIMLGAIVSAPMQLPDKGILQGLFILALVVILQRGLTLYSVKNKKAESVLEGENSMLVKDGILQLDEMKKARITHQQIFEKIRLNDIYNLGQVKRMYIEACGIISIFKTEDTRPGLSILPPDDKKLFDGQDDAKDKISCSNCGYTVDKDANHECPVCHHTKWVDAVMK